MALTAPGIELQVADLLDEWGCEDDSMSLLAAAEELRAGQRIEPFPMAVQAFATLCCDQRVFGQSRELLRSRVFLPH